MHNMGVVLLPDRAEGETGAYLEMVKQRLCTMLRSYTNSGHIIFDLQSFVKDSTPLSDIVAMVRDALQDIKTDCGWTVHLVWEHTDDDQVNLVDHMWGPRR